MKFVKLTAYFILVILIGIGIFEISTNIFFATNGKIIVPRRNIFYVPDDELSYVNRPNYEISAKDNFMDYIPISIKINDLGMRDEQNSSDWKDKRIWIVGDSNTFGFGLENKDTFVKQLESLININATKKVNVINGGVAGYNIFQANIFIKRYL